MDAQVLQTALRRLGYWHGQCDGNLIGSDFRCGLRKFQSDKCLDVDGWVGPHTEEAVQRYINAASILNVQLEDFRVFRWTNYYVADERDYSPAIPASVPCFDVNGKLIAKVGATFFASMALEGTGKVRAGGILNVTGRWVPAKHGDYADVLAVAKRWNWIPDKAGYAGIRVVPDGSDWKVVQAFAWTQVTEMGVGYGVSRGVPMNPYRTLAADTGAYASSQPVYRGKGGLVPVGTKVFMVDLLGKVMPDGTIHDGWATVNDTGGAIFGRHFDIFTGTQTIGKNIPFAQMGHVWFDGIAGRVNPSDSYGLVPR